MLELKWRSDSRLVVGGTSFTLAPTGADTELESALASDGFVLRKPRWMVEAYRQLAEQHAVSNIVEIGIDRGGSTALLALLFEPARLIAVDLKPTRRASLDDFITTHALQNTVRPYFGVDQADRARLKGIIDAEFNTTPLDLVVDDASHLLNETTATFNLLFPRLRPSGLYVIEDWSWQHMRDEAWDRFVWTPNDLDELARLLAADDTRRSAAPLSLLILELVLTAGYADEIVAEVSTLRRGWTVIKRGRAELDHETFDITASYGSLGRSVLRGETSR